MKPKPDKRVKRQRVKAQQKLSRMARKGKLRKHVRDRVKEMRRQKMAPQEKRMAQIKGDWLIDRSVRERERQRIDDGESEDSDGQLPIDPALINAHFYRNNRLLKNDSDDDQMDEEEMEEQLRTFVSMEEDEERALLPVKINGKLVKRMRAVEEEDEEEMKPEPFLANEMEEEEEGSSEIKEEVAEVDVTKMSEQELHHHTAKLAAEAENRLAQATDAIVTAPQENVSKFRLLLQMAAGEGESQLVREQLQKLATASLAELFVNVVPGYEIRTLSETEKSQRMKKETKKLVSYEQSLLAYYVKYLRLLEKCANKLLSKGKAKPIDESSFPAQFGFLSVRCMCRLAEKLTHFNYARNILTCLVRLSFNPWRRMLDEICATIGRVFAADRHFAISLHGAKAIAMAVNKKAGYVPAELVATLLALNITEVEQKSTDARMALNKQKQKQRQIGGNSRRARKYDKQIGKIDAELKEAVEADTRSAKLKLATETMKYVFLTYCRILKRMSATALLRPVLEGLSKFVHLINVELYDDLARHMGKLVEQKQLKLSEVLLCVRTASVILSGEGQLLDMDLLAFYRALFASLPNICFQPEESLASDLSLLVESVLLLLVRRRRMVSLARVAAFAKRIALLALPLQSRFQLCLLLLLRRLFIAHSGLKFMIHPEEDEGEGALVASGNFRSDSEDPDHSNSMGTVLVAELSLLAKHPNPLVRSVAMNLLDGVPATGKHRLDAKWTNLEPAECLVLEDPMVTDSCAPFHNSILAHCRDRKRTYCSSTLCSTLCDFLRDRGGKHRKRVSNDR